MWRLSFTITVILKSGSCAIHVHVAGKLYYYQCTNKHCLSCGQLIRQISTTLSGEKQVLYRYMYY